MKIELTLEELTLILNWAYHAPYPEDEDCELMEKLDKIMEEMKDG